MFSAGFFATHAGTVKTCHVIEEIDRCLCQRQGQRGTAAFAETQAEVEQRLCLQGGQLRLVPAFGGMVAQHSVIAYSRCQLDVHQQGRGDDETVDEQQHALLGRSQDGAGEHGDLETAEFG